MPINLYSKAVFLKSAARVNQLPEDSGYEVAFAGRSNAGKSSALNCLTNNKNLARTSKTPGRTQLINLFSLDEQRRLVENFVIKFTYRPIDNLLLRRNGFRVNFVLGLCGTI